MTFMTFMNLDLFNAYACRSSELCFYELNLFSNPSFLWATGSSIVGQLLIIYFPPLQEIFQTEALPLIDLLKIIVLSSSILVLDTVRKKFTFFRRYCSDNRTGPYISRRRKSRSRKASRKRANVAQLEQVAEAILVVTHLPCECRHQAPAVVAKYGLAMAGLRLQCSRLKNIADL